MEAMNMNNPAKDRTNDAINKTTLMLIAGRIVLRLEDGGNVGGVRPVVERRSVPANPDAERSA
jgi:hypothetical protein